MLTDALALSELRDSWRGVEALRDKVSGALLGAFATGGTFAIFAADAAHNLPFVHACTVLEMSLRQLKVEGHFPSTKTRPQLGHMIDESKGQIPWKDVGAIKVAVSRRNDLAHKADVLPRKECWKHIDAIREELVGWGIVNW
jgi:hypothetical protein